MDRLPLPSMEIGFGQTPALSIDVHTARRQRFSGVRCAHGAAAAILEGRPDRGATNGHRVRPVMVEPVRCWRTVAATIKVLSPAQIVYAA